MKNKAFYLPAFEIHGAVRHGGEARTRQIYESLKQGHTIIPIYPQRLGNIKIVDIIKGLRCWFKWNIKPNYFHFLLRYIISFRKAGAKRGDTCFFENQAGPVRIGGMVALSLGLKTHCFPHNIESLSGWGYRDPITGKKLEDYFAWEIRFLAKMQDIFAISKGDLVVCKTVGINGKYFPYRPPQVLQQMFSSIKNGRKKRFRLVVFGSGNNPLSLDGNIQVVNTLVQRGIDNICVSGFEVDRIKNKITNKKVKIFSSLPKKEYTELLSQVAVAIVHQDKGTGVLTRIENLLACGIPVVASLVAAREFYDRKHVYTYQNISEIPRILGKIKRHIKN